MSFPGSQPYLRLNKTIGRKFPPTPDNVDVQWDAELGCPVFIDGDGNTRPLGISTITDEDGHLLAEVIPDNLEVDSIQLADTTGLALPDGTLGLDASGALVIHDGETDGGNPILGKRWLGASSITAAQLNTAGTLVEIARLTIPANQVVNGDRWRVIGQVSVYNDLASYSSASATPKIGWYQLGASSTALNRGYSIAWDPTKVTCLFDLTAQFEIADSGTAVSLAWTAQSGSVVLNQIAAGTPAITYPTVGTLVPGRTTPSGQDLVIVLYGSLDADSGADSTGNCYFVSDVKLIKSV